LLIGEKTAVREFVRIDAPIKKKSEQQSGWWVTKAVISEQHIRLVGKKSGKKVV
jgi:hypothetical protein